MTKKLFKKVIKDTFPVMTGYVVLAIGFGILMRAKGYGLVWSLAMSLFIYAGSMQYAAIGLLTGGVSLLTVALTTVAVNARHVFYGVSMVDKYRGTGARKLYLIFALTDETYSLVATAEKDENYFFYVSLFNHIYWLTGTVIGALIGSTVTIDTAGIDFALTALFITIFLSQFLGEKKYFSGSVGIISSVVCLLIFGKDSFLIPSMLLIAVVLFIGMGKEKTNE